MYNIAICDDKDDIVEQIEEYVVNWFRKNNLKFNVDSFYDGEELISSLNKKNTYDLIFLDIEMNSKSGIDVGKYIRTIHKNYKTDIVFVSGSNSYDRQLFSFQPLGFISKPVSEDDLNVTIDVFLNRSFKKHFFTYKVNTETSRVLLSDILYFKSNGRKINIIMRDDTDSFYGKLADLETELHQQGFILANRSVLVNLELVRSFTKSELTMILGEIINISNN